MNIDFVLTIIALVCFIAAAAGIPSRVNLIASGLALLTITLLTT